MTKWHITIAKIENDWVSYYTIVTYIHPVVYLSQRKYEAKQQKLIDTNYVLLHSIPVPEKMLIDCEGYPYTLNDEDLEDAE